MFPSRALRVSVMILDSFQGCSVEPTEVAKHNDVCIHFSGREGLRLLLWCGKMPQTKVNLGGKDLFYHNPSLRDVRAGT